MGILFFLLEILLTVLFAALKGESNVDDKAKDRKQPVSDIPEETLEFISCAICGKPNPVERVSCSACGALQGTART